MNRIPCWALALACLPLIGCPYDNAPRKPDVTKGTVTGVVICTDTGKPARLAAVQLLPSYPKADSVGPNGDQIDLDENGTTGLDGRFKIEAVPPGDYYAFATLGGYIDPTLAVDTNRLGAQASDRERLADEIDQWKDHLVKLTVAVHRTSDISIEIDRGAEIDGTVSYDDSSPAVGIRFELLRKTDNGRWVTVGSKSDSDWSLEEKSDGRGRFFISELPEGEYKVCALLPAQDQNLSPHYCLGGGFRKEKAETVKVAAGETHAGVDIILPLDGLFTVAGSVAAGGDGHAPGQAIVHLLYADDREEARLADLEKDGSFSFAWVPADNYILKVTDAEDAPTSTSAAGPDASNTAEPGAGQPDARAATAPRVHKYMDKEAPLSVQSDMEDVLVTLAETPPPQQAAQ